jgi:hypothetical protein
MSMRFPCRVALVAASLAGCAVVMAAEPITSDAFAPGWQQHTKSLISSGQKADMLAQRVVGNTWTVPDNLPRGHYVVVERHRDGTAELIDGFQFEITGAVRRDLYMSIPYRYVDVQALPAEYVPAMKAQ